MNIRLAIIIINHNYGRFLATAIRSALDQSLPADEVIVVDDGSTDDSREIIASFVPKITPVLKEPGGHVTAVNAGYAATSCDLCIFLDADDLLYPNCVETILRKWQPGDAKAQYRLDTINAAGQDQNLTFPHFPKDLTPEAVREQSFRWGTYPWTVSSGNVFSRELLDQLLPIDPREIYRSPDGYISKMAPMFGNVRSFQDILGAYRVHGANAWAQGGGALDMAPIIRWLKFDVVLQQKFQQIAAQRGLTVAKPSEMKTLQQMEYRLLAARFAPAEFGSPCETLGLLFRSGISVARKAPNVSGVGRLVWMAWIFTLAFMPKFLVRKIFGIARGQTGRGGIYRFLISLSRGSSN